MTRILLHLAPLSTYLKDISLKYIEFICFAYPSVKKKMYPKRQEPKREGGAISGEKEWAGPADRWKGQVNYVTVWKSDFRL